MKILPMYEHEWLEISDVFKASHFEKLVKFNEENGNKFFQIGNKKIKSTQYVGIVTVDDLTIEILPKVSRNDSNDLPWSELLSEMLIVGNNLKVHRTFKGSLGIGKRSILDIYIAIFLEEVLKVIHHGVVKKYRTLESNIPTIKGAIDFPKTLIKNFVHNERHFCRYTHYDTINIYNRTLVEVLNKIPSLTNSIELKSITRKLKIEFNGMDGLKAEEYKKVQGLKIDRKTISYQDAIELAKIFLNLQSPNLKAGSKNIITLLFDMNDLFEKYVAIKLQKHINQLSGTQLKLQSKIKFWENKSIKPDMVFYDGDKTIVLDTKWKLPDHNRPSDDDLKQIYVYNEYYDSQNGFLLYPFYSNEKSKEVSGIYHINGKKCSMGYVKLFDKNKKINESIGAEIYDLITNSISEAS